MSDDDQVRLFDVVPAWVPKPWQGGYPTKLYDGRPPAETSPTSRTAGDSVAGRSGSLRATVLRLIRITGPNGLTDDDLERAMGIRHQTVSARRRELVLLGEVKDSGRARKTSSGRQATVWVAV